MTVVGTKDATVTKKQPVTDSAGSRGRVWVVTNLPWAGTDGEALQEAFV